MLLLSLLAAPALANERFFAWSYGADTVSAGHTELEPIITVETHHEDGELVAEWTHEVELEHGITNALEAGAYLQASQTNDGALTFSAYKARLRYRFWPLGTRGVDLAGYVEYIGSPTFDAHGFEGKLIVAHEGPKLRAALNVTAEVEVEGAEVEPVLEPTAGVAWRFNRQFALGAEGKMEMVLTDPVEGPYFWAGPTLHLAGKEGRLWWTLSAIIGLTDATRGDAEVEARSLVGIDL